MSGKGSGAQRAWASACVRTAGMASIALAMCSGTRAAQVETDVDGLKLSVDNTVAYSAAFRLRGQDTTLLGNANTDDGDRNFGRGVVSDRIDVRSELDAQFGLFGFRVSGAGWYDQAYNQRNDNPGAAGGASPNQLSVAANRFTRATRELQGHHLELLDVFGLARFDVGDARALVRVGQHAMVWGESLFYGANAIAGGMSPVDVTKMVAVPGTQFKDAVRPVPQVSGQVQLTPEVAVGAYYQFLFRSNRLPAVGSYFSQSDLLVDGAERILLGPGVYAPRQADRLPRHGGQGGLQLRVRAMETDFGLYAIRFDDKAPQLVTRLVDATPGTAPTILPGSYFLAYHEGIGAVGASASHTFGPANVALELSMRNNMDLASSHAVDASALTGGTAADNRGHAAYAVGRTAHANLSTVWSLDPTVLFADATVLAELAWNRVLACKRNCDRYDPSTQLGTLDNHATRDAWAMRAQFEPSYHQVLAGLDLSVPLSIGYSPAGSRSMAIGPGVFPAAGGGDVTLGVNGAYLDAWRFGAAYTRYFGKPATFTDADNSFTYGQSLADRDFMAVSLRRTF